MPKLQILDANGNPVWDIPLEGDLTFGRDSINPADRGISRSQFRVHPGEAGLLVEEAGGRNPTLLNGTPITKPRRLRHGDRITAGSTNLQFADETAAEAGASAPDNTMVHARLSMQTFQTDVAGIDRGSRGEMKAAEKADEVDVERLKIALDLFLAIGAESEAERVMEIVLDKAVTLFQADRGALLQQEGDRFVCKLARGREDLLGEDMRFSNTLLTTATEGKEALLFSESQAGALQAVSIADIGIRAAMCVPLMQGDDVVGVIQLDTLSTGNAFTERDLELLVGFAAYAARALERAKLARDLQAEELNRQQLGRLLSPNLVDEVMAGNLEVKRGGETREVVILFADMRGFTTMSGGMEAQNVVDLLNDFFEPMVETLFEHGGTLDKFIGDCIMAFWGAPVAYPDYPKRGVAAAREMMRKANDLSAKWQASGRPPLDVGMGLALGKAVAGYVGSSATLSYTVIGTSVNLASRLCSKAAAGEVLISSILAKEAAPDAVPAGEVELKGFAQPVPVFRLPV